MNRTILVPVDGSRLSERAIPYAVRLAREPQTRLLLLRVFSPRQDGEEQLENAEAESYLQNLTSRQPIPARIQTKVVTGDAAEAILVEAEQSKAGLLVMSTHGRSGIGRWLYGSVADAVMRHATVPVLLVPANCTASWPTDRVRRILVTLDGSALSETVLGPAVELAQMLNAEIILVRVSEPYPISTGDPTGYVLMDPTPELEAAGDYLQAIAGRLHALGQTVRTISEFGFAVSCIHEVAREQQADLIALATHGSGGLTRLVMGSVATGVVQTSGLPVLVVRPIDASASTAPASPVGSEAGSGAVPESGNLGALAVQAAHGDDERVTDLVSALASPDLLARQAVEPELSQVTDPLVWQRILELRAVGQWNRRPVSWVTGDSAEASVLERRLDDLLMPSTHATVEDAKREALLASLKDTTPEIQVQALDAIGRRGDRDLIPSVIAALAGDDLEVQEHAAETLGHLAEVDALGALLRALHDEHNVLASTISRALTRIGCAAVPSLVVALTDPAATVRWHAAEALAGIGDERALPALLDALEDPDLAVRWNAARALSHLGKPAVVALLRMLEVHPLSPWLCEGTSYVLRHAMVGEARREIREVIDSLGRLTASVEVPVRAAEALAALRTTAEATA